MAFGGPTLLGESGHPRPPEAHSRLYAQSGGGGIRTHARQCLNALAGRRLKPLGHPSGAGLSCPTWVRTRTLLIQSQACCQLHHGAILT